MKRIKTFWLIFVCLAVTPLVAHADPADMIDMDWSSFVTLVGGGGSVFVIIGLVILLMGINYGLNFVFIGLPAMKLGSIALKPMIKDMFYLTLLGQIADRVGLMLAFLFTTKDFYYLLHGRTVTVDPDGPIFLWEFVCAAIAIAALVLYFSFLRWRLRLGKALLVTLCAVIFTNPVYWLLITAIADARGS